MSPPRDVAPSACPFSERCKRPSGGLTLEGGYPRRLLSKAARIRGRVVLASGFVDARAPHERLIGTAATYTVSVPDRRALAHPGLALLSEKPNFSRPGTPLFSSVGTRTLRRAPVKAFVRTATPIPSGSERGWLCVSVIYDPRLATRATLYACVSWELRPNVHPTVDRADYAPFPTDFAPSSLTPVRFRCFGDLRSPSVLRRAET